MTSFEAQRGVVTVATPLHEKVRSRVEAAEMGFLRRISGLINLVGQG